MLILDYGNHKKHRKTPTIQVDLAGKCDVRIGYVLPFKDETFDVVISNQVMEHNFQIESYYREAARVLKPFGYMFLHFPHKYQPYDGHTKRFLLHWFLKDKPGFNWKSRAYHKRVSKPWFPVWIDLNPYYRQVKAFLFKREPYTLLE